MIYDTGQVIFGMKVYIDDKLPEKSPIFFMSAEITEELLRIQKEGQEIRRKISLDKD